jgi:hypothetical protein
MFPDIEAESKTRKDMSSHGSREFALKTALFGIRSSTRAFIKKSSAVNPSAK